MRGIPPRIDEMSLIAGVYRMVTFNVRVTGEYSGVIRCEVSGINRPDFERRVRVSRRERKQGVSLEEKLTMVAFQEKQRMEAHNAKLKKRKEMERRIKDVLINS